MAGIALKVPMSKLTISTDKNHQSVLLPEVRLLGEETAI